MKSTTTQADLQEFREGAQIVSREITQYSNHLLEVTRQFGGSKYQPLIEQASHAYINQEWKKLNTIFNKFPSEYSLLEALVAKLKGKSVETNLKKVLNNEAMNINDAIIATSSLLTHCSIEVKKAPEYKMLRENLLKKLTKLITEDK